MGFAIFHEMSVFFKYFCSVLSENRRSWVGVKFFRKLHAWKQICIASFCTKIYQRRGTIENFAKFFSDNFGELHFLLILNSKENDDEFLKKGCSSKICTKWNGAIFFTYSRAQCRPHVFFNAQWSGERNKIKVNHVGSQSGLGLISFFVVCLQ